jgi:lysophospholipase L1-like esterase
MGTEEKECLLYLPLYDELKSLEIGVSSDAHIRKGENPFKEKIVVYGSSILQGASASRPGMAYPARLSRSSGYNFINLGLSGNGKMEKEVAEMLADIDADAFILDCIPNPSPKEITDRTVDFVMTLRQKHPDTPIIVIQTLIRETGNFNQKARENVKRQNEAIAEQVEVLRKKNVKNLYFIKEDQFLGTDHEGTVDGTHPNDLGFDRMLKKYKPAISKILKIKFKAE